MMKRRSTASSFPLFWIILSSLKGLDTDRYSADLQRSPPRSVLRADEPQPGLSRQELLANAPQVEAGQFRVPPVLE